MHSCHFNTVAFSTIPRRRWGVGSSLPMYNNPLGFCLKHPCICISNSLGFPAKYGPCVSSSGEVRTSTSIFPTKQSFSKGIGSAVLGARSRPEGCSSTWKRPNRARYVDGDQPPKLGAGSSDVECKRRREAEVVPELLLLLLPMSTLLPPLLLAGGAAATVETTEVTWFVPVAP